MFDFLMKLEYWPDSGISELMKTLLQELGKFSNIA
jgi:hypothetical protein